MSREEKVTELLKPIVEDLGYEWVGVEYHHNSVNSILRIYVDKPNGGIDMDGVVEVTEQVNPILDAEDPINSAYTLEVSSPGLDRPLFTLSDFIRFQGKTVKIHLSRPIERRRRFEGIIQAVNEDKNTIELEIQDGKQSTKITLDFANIDKARLVPVF